jgi:hypothetical protein
MKNAIELRAHIITKIGSSGANLLGTRSYGDTIEQSILILPDNNLEDGGVNFPAIIDGSPVTYQGIEVIIYDSYERIKYLPLLNLQAQLNAPILIWIKDWNTSESSNLKMAGFYISQGLNVIDTITDPNPDQAPIQKAIILVVNYAAYG